MYYSYAIPYGSRNLFIIYISLIYVSLILHTCMIMFLKQFNIVISLLYMIEQIGKM